MDAAAHVDRGATKRFPQVKGRGQLSDGRLTRTDFIGRGRPREPGRERFLAGRRRGNRQEFEQRAATEEIEIVRVEMPLVPEPLPRFTGANPAILDARQPALVM